MSRCRIVAGRIVAGRIVAGWIVAGWIVAVLVGGLQGQEPKAAKEPKPAESEQLPPEEDKAAVPQQYSFNPVRSKRDVEVGNFYFRKGDWKAAAGRFREATLWNEGNAEAWLRWAETEEKRGIAKAAKSAYEKYLELAPEARNAAEVRQRMGRLKVR